MAKIFGRPESEKEILKKCPSRVEKFGDIKNIFQDSKNQFKKEKKEFFDNLPTRKKKEKEKLDEIRKQKEKTIREYENKIRNIEEKVEEKKNNKKWFSVISNHLKIFFQKYISKPWNVRKIKKSESKQEETLEQLEEHPNKIFNQQHNELIKRLNRFEKIMNDSFYHGAEGEIEVLNELSKLNDNYRILCGLNIELDDWHNYQGEHNLKSAQMDLVVVSKKGVFLIEVKNWSDEHLNKNKELSPHEQLDRAGKVLYIFLKSELEKRVGFLEKKVSLKGKDLNKLLIPIQNNISYDPNYKWVWIKNVSEIKNHIREKKNVLEDYEVKKITKILKPYITEK